MPSACNWLHRRLHLGEISDDVEAALGGHFFAPLRHQAGILRFDAAAKVEHLRRHRRFQVHVRAQQRADRQHVGVLDMAPVFAHVQRDRIGAGFFSLQGRLQRVGVGGAARVAQGRHVVDIDAQIDDGAGRFEEAHDE
jgi:hypothetical protein